MKKSLLYLITCLSVIFSITACNNPTNSNPSTTPSSSTVPSPNATQAPTTNPSVGAISKESVIAVYNCVKTKAPELALAMDSYIVSVNVQPDDKWAINAGPTKDGLKRLEAYGCFYK